MCRLRGAVTTTNAASGFTKWRLNATSAQNGQTALVVGDIQMRGSIGGANLATGGTASADSSLGTGFQASNAFDGSASTCCGTAFSSFPHWIEYDFPSAVTIKEVAITADGSGGNQGFCVAAGTIQYWDGSAWQNAITIPSGQTWTAGQTRVFS